MADFAEGINRATFSLKKLLLLSAKIVVSLIRAKLIVSEKTAHGILEKSFSLIRAVKGRFSQSGWPCSIIYANSAKYD